MGLGQYTWWNNPFPEPSEDDDVDVDEDEWGNERKPLGRPLPGMNKSTSSVITWQRGFPSETGMYLVELADGEHVVTPYQAERRYVEADGDSDNRTGWICLTHSRATVVAWAKIPKRKPT